MKYRSIFLTVIIILAAALVFGCTKQKSEQAMGEKEEAVQSGEAKNAQPKDQQLDTAVQKAIEQTKADPEVAVMETNQGKIIIGFFPDVAPNHVARFKELAGEGFYDGILFHRVIPDFVVQAGDPQTKDPDFPREMHGTGGSGKKLEEEFNNRPHLPGTLSAARSHDPNSADSQFFICHKRVPHLDKKYTVYGQVLKGMDVVEKIVNAERDQRDNPLQPQKIISVKIVKREEAGV